MFKVEIEENPVVALGVIATVPTVLNWLDEADVAELL